MKVPFGAAAQPSPFSAQAVDLAAQRGEYERVQVVVAADRPLHNLTIAVSPLATPGLSVRSFQQGYIWLDKNFTAALPATEPFRPNISLGAGYYPDPLLPIPPEGLTVPAGWAQPLMLTLNVSRDDAAAGVHNASVAVTAAGEQICSVPFGVEVWDLAIPSVGAKGSLSTQFNLAMQVNHLHAYKLCQ